MSEWWAGLSLRERLLVGVAGGLVAIIILWQFMLVPSLSAKAEARANLEAANRTFSRLQQAYMYKQQTRVVDAQIASRALSLDAFRAEVMRLATDKGLAISRLQGRGTDTVGLVFDQADPRLVFFWLEDVEVRLGGRVTRLSLEQAGAGFVRVSVDIQGAV